MLPRSSASHELTDGTAERTVTVLEVLIAGGVFVRTTSVSWPAQIEVLGGEGAGEKSIAEPEGLRERGQPQECRLPINHRLWKGE